MPDDLPPLNALRSFVQAGHELSFSRAAGRLGVTPGAVSRLVRKLEEHLGVRLLERTAHGLALTAQGELYLRDVSGPLTAVEAATRRLVGSRNPNRIVVACYPTFAARWLLPRWSRFFDRHPEIDVQIATSLTDVDFRRDDGTDIAIRLGAEGDLAAPPAGTVCDKLLDIEIVAVSAPGLFAGCRTDLQRVERLARQVLIHSRPLPDEWRQWLDAFARSPVSPAVARALKAVDPGRGPEFETLNLSFQAAAEGIGVAVGMRTLAAAEIADGSLVCPFAFRRRSSRCFQVVARRRGANGRAVDLYRRWLTDEARRVGSA